MGRRKYTDQQIIEAVPKASSYRELAKLLGVAGAGSSFYNMKKIVARLNLSTEHFLGKSHAKRQRIPLEDILNNKRYLASSKLKNRLFENGTFERVCSCCELREWNDKPIPLELDHINGNPRDNQLHNLRVLCPNCHAQTDMYRGRNIGRLKTD